MKNEPVSPDDPRLTAFALGELDPAEHAEFAARVEADPAARALVEEIRASAEVLAGALVAEPVAMPKRGAAARAAATPRRGKLIRFPQFYYIVSGLAAACFAIVFFRAQQNEVPSGQGGQYGVVRHQPRGTTVAQPPVESAIQIQPAPMADLSQRFFATAENATSTFPLRVGDDSYVKVTAALRGGEKPRREEVHVAEMINAFNYSWPQPKAGETFSTVLEAAPAPWAPQNRLVRVGLKGHGSEDTTIARNAQVQVDFNPSRVQAWRLIGFERNGAAGVRGVSPGETLQGGAVVTALYEVTPTQVADKDGAAFMTLSLRYNDAAGAPREVAAQLDRSADSFEAASGDLRFIASVAAFGSALKDTPLAKQISPDLILRWASAAAKGRPEREEFLQLLR